MAKKESVTFNPSTHGKRLEGLLKEASNAKFQIESLNTIIKDQRDAAKDIGIPAKHFNQLLKIYHKDQRDDFEDTNMEILDVYDSVFKSSDGDD